MFAVIFKAEINFLDSKYDEMASRMRELAIKQYGCSDFVSVTQGNLEIAISYWDTLEQIQNWRQDPEHLTAQELGRTTWYKSYKVEILEVIREYGSDSY